MVCVSATVSKSHRSFLSGIASAGRDCTAVHDLTVFVSLGCVDPFRWVAGVSVCPSSFFFPLLTQWPALPQPLQFPFLMVLPSFRLWLLYFHCRVLLPCRDDGPSSCPGVFPSLSLSNQPPEVRSSSTKSDRTAWSVALIRSWFIMLVRGPFGKGLDRVLEKNRLGDFHFLSAELIEGLSELGNVGKGVRTPPAFKIVEPVVKEAYAGEFELICVCA